MDLLSELQKIKDCSDFVQTNNYYYDYHQCSATNSKQKVMLDFTLKNDLTDDILRFGICDKCRLCIYHKDYQGKDF